jgi:solute carrier family 35 protein F1/2
MGHYIRFFFSPILTTITIANGTAVLAFKNTSILSALVLNSWTIPCVMLLSTWFLHTKYHRVHFRSAFICLSGLAMLIYGDTISNDDATGDLYSNIFVISLCINSVLFSKP